MPRGTGTSQHRHLPVQDRIQLVLLCRETISILQPPRPFEIKKKKEKASRLGSLSSSILTGTPAAKKEPEQKDYRYTPSFISDTCQNPLHVSPCPSSTKLQTELFTLHQGDGIF